MNGEPTQDNIPSEMDYFNTYIENQLMLLRDIYDSKTINFIRAKMEEELQQYVIDGKDIILANLKGMKSEIFMKQRQLFHILIGMQVKYYMTIKDGKPIMLPGIKEAIKYLFMQITDLLLSSRADGEDRDRILISNPEHNFNRAIRNMGKKRNIIDRVTGKENEEAYYG